MSTKQLIIGTAGIYTAYLTLSLVNERLFTHEYINVTNKFQNQYQKDKFKYPDLCVCVSSFLCALFSLLRGKLQRDPTNPIPLKEYFILGSLYTINILAASYALLFISYPIRVVSDKCGYLTAVIVGVYFSRIKRHDVKLQPKKVIIAIFITMGAVLFAIFREQEASKAWELVYNPDTMWIGYLLMLISITGEALFTDSQAYCKIAYKPTINHLMFTVNMMTAFICIGSLVAKGELGEALTFCKEHPFVGLDIVMIGVLQVLGQLSIYSIVLNFKQHIFPLVSTTRKVFTVLLSIYIFNHKMNLYQWLGLIFVFGGMGYELVDELYADLFKHKKHTQPIQPQQQIRQSNKQISSVSSTMPKSQKRPSSETLVVREKPWYQRLKMQPQDYQLDLSSEQEQETQNESPKNIGQNSRVSLQRSGKQKIKDSRLPLKRGRLPLKENYVFDQTRVKQE